MRGLLAVAVLCIAACQAPPAEMTDAEIAQIEAEVMELMEAWLDSWSMSNADRETRVTMCENAFQFASPDFVLFNGGSQVDREGWLRVCRYGFRNTAEFSGSWTDMEVRVLSPDAALFIGTYSATYVNEDDSATRHYPTAAQVILAERTATGWGITVQNNWNGPRAEG